jgi:hypothetical protein
MIKIVYFIITYVLSGLILVAFLKCILKRHEQIISQGEIIIIGFGLGPIIISLVLCLLFLFFPDKSSLFYILAITVLFGLMLFVGRKEVADIKQLLNFAKLIKNQENDIILIISLVGIIMLYAFIQGINFPIISRDASTYAYYGKYLYKEKNLHNYPMKRADEETGAYLAVGAPPGFPLIYTWFYLLQGNTRSDILPRTVSPIYGLYLIILLWIILRTRGNKYCGAFAILFLVLIPLFAKQLFDNTIDPVRIYLATLSLICLAKFIESESFILGILVIMTAFLSIYVHRAGVLVLGMMIVLYLLLSKRSIRKRIALIILIMLFIAGAQYGFEQTKFGRSIGSSFRSLFSSKTIVVGRSARKAAFGTDWLNKIDKGEVGRLRMFFYERLQIFSQLHIFGLAYYIFLAGVVYWIAYIKKREIDLVLLFGAVFFAIPVIYKYYLNHRYISTINPIAAYFGGLSLGVMYPQIREKGLFKTPKFKWIIVVIPIIVAIILYFFAASLASINHTKVVSVLNSNYTKMGSIKKTILYMFASEEAKLYNGQPTFKAIEYINTQTPKESVVLVLRAPEYFYHAKRKGISYFRDPKIGRAFRRIHNTKEAHGYLLSVGVDYVILDPTYKEHSYFKQSEMMHILTDHELSRLVLPGYVEVYQLITD